MPSVTPVRLVATNYVPHAATVPAIEPTDRTAEPPRQPTLDAERRYRKQRLAASFRLFGKFGYDMGGAGHITARDPEFPDRFWVNPAGVHFSHIRVSDLLCVDHEGHILESGPVRRLNRAAFAIHSELHKARPDVVAAAHAHSMHGKAFASLGRLLDPITQDSCAFFERHSLFDRFSGVVLDPDEGQRIAATLGNGHGVILQNHGLLTVATTVDGAVWRYIAMENAAEAQLRADAAGRPILIDPDIARLTAGQIGTETGSWYAFQPYWDDITRASPDLFE